MYKSIFISISIIFLAFTASGCATDSMTAPPIGGGLYTSVISPTPVAATEDVGISKMGESSCESFLHLVAYGDCSVEAAMKNGGISKIHHIDKINTFYWFFYNEYTVKVYGE